MATRTNYDFTKFAAIKAAYMVVSGKSVEDACRDVMGDKYDPNKHTGENLARRLSHEVHTLAAAAARPKAESAASKRNTARANELASEWGDGRVFSLNDICERYSLVNSKGGWSYAAATAIVNKLSAMGKLEKHAPVKGKASYSIKA